MALIVPLLFANGTVIPKVKTPKLAPDVSPWRARTSFNNHETIHWHEGTVSYTLQAFAVNHWYRYSKGSKKLFEIFQ